MGTALSTAGESSGRLVIVSGEPGIGKTRLVHEIANQASARGNRVVWGYCHEEAGAPPYWPWVRIIRQLIEPLSSEVLRVGLGAGASDIAELIPELHQHLPDLEPAAKLRDQAEERFRLFGSVTRLLINLSQHHTLLLVLDDLHWADVPSLRLVEFLAKEITNSKLLLVGTYRDTELSRQHPLSDALGTLARLPHAERVHLSGLGPEDVHRFITTATCAAPPTWLTRAIHEQTEGNSLFLREVVRFLHQQGHLGPAAAAAPSVVQLPEGVCEVIGRRLNLLSPTCNDILRLASVIGRRFALDMLLRAGRSYPEDAVHDALDEALAARVIEETGSGQYQFAHTLIRTTLYDELRAGQRRRLHRIVGEAIEAQHRRNIDPVLHDLARHFQAAGFGTDIERAISYAIRAGQRADALLAFEDAVSFFQAALDMLDQTEGEDQQQRCGLLLTLGEAQRKSSEFVAALKTLKDAADLARDRRLSTLFAQVALAYENTEWRYGMPDGVTSEKLLEEALTGLTASDIALQVQVIGRLARARLHAGAVSDARRLATRAVDLARTLNDPAALAAAMAGLNDFHWEPSETRQMLAIATELIIAGEKAGLLEIAQQAHIRCAVLWLELGDMEAAEREIAAVKRIGVRIRQPLFAMYELSLDASVALLRGELQEAERLLGRAMQIQPPGAAYSADPLSVLIFTLRRQQGRLGEIAPLLRLFVRQSPSASIWKPGLGVLYLELGDLTAAKEVFENLAADTFASLPRDSRLATCLIYLAEICAALGNTVCAPVLYSLLFPWADRNVVLGGGTGCWGPAARFLGLLATTMNRWTDAERHFSDAVDMCQRISAHAPLAHTRHDLAVMLLSRGFPGDRERAGSLLRQALDSAMDLGLAGLAKRVSDRMTDLPPVGTPSVVPDGLTARELDVIRLLAIGRGNADIALVLDISLNTVATHVRNILLKTGCANRTEAAAYAIQHGLGPTLPSAASHARSRPPGRHNPDG